MSIAEKLTTIAENQQRVFNTGYEKGKSEGGNTEKIKEWVSCGLLFNFQNYTGTNIDVESDLALAYSMEQNHISANKTKGLCYNNQNIKECRIIFPNAKNARFSFCDCHNLEYITVDMTKVVDTKDGYTGFNSTFAYCYALKRIDGQISLLNCVLERTFDLCYSLEYIAFMPLSINNSLSLADIPNLSEEGVKTLIDALVTITDGVARTLTLHATVKGNLTDEQIATITDTKGWTLV